MTSTKAKLYTVLSDHFLIAESEITDILAPGDIPMWDSLGQIQLMLRLEKDFAIQLSVDEVMSIHNVGDMIKVLEKKTGAPKQDASPIVVADTSLSMPAAVSIGRGAIQKLKAEVSGNVCVVLSKSRYAESIAKTFEGILLHAAVSFVYRDAGEPTVESISRVAERLQECKPTTVIAVGGGSTIDTAKLALALTELGAGSLRDLTDRDLPKSLRTALVAVPTLFGSGAEASSAAIFQKGANGEKSILFSHALLPSRVILDPNLAGEVAHESFLAGLWDALSHAIEGSVSSLKNSLVMPYAGTAVRSLLRMLSEGASVNALDELCEASFFAGVVQNHTSVGLAHAVAHQLNRYGIPHGIATGMLLPSVIELNHSKDATVYGPLLQEARVRSVSELSGLIHSAVKASGVVPSTTVLNTLVRERSEIAIGALNDRTIRTNPVRVTQQDIESLIERMVRSYE